MKKTPFRLLAEKIDKDIKGGYWECCYELPHPYNIYFGEYFEPTLNETLEYNHRFWRWMNTVEDYEAGNYRRSNELRILALLICEQHYLHYNKKSK